MPSGGPATGRLAAQPQHVVAIIRQVRLHPASPSREQRAAANVSTIRRSPYPQRRRCAPRFRIQACEMGTHVRAWRTCAARSGGRLVGLLARARRRSRHSHYTNAKPGSA